MLSALSGTVRNYLLSLPDEYGISRSQPRQGFRPASLSTSEPQKRRVSSGPGHTDPLARIRRAALDMLTILRELDESARVPLLDDVSFSVSIIHVGGRREYILVWDEESERLPRERWDERLVLGSGWLYKQDLKIEELEKQQRVVAQYLDTVDEVLFGGRKAMSEDGGVGSQGEGLAVRCTLT
jgi:hypothetical protein